MCRKSVKVVKNALGVGVGVVTAKKVGEAGYNEVVQVGAGAAGYGITYGVSSLIENLVERAILIIKAKKLADDICDDFDEDDYESFDEFLEYGDEYDDDGNYPEYPDESELPEEEPQPTEPVNNGGEDETAMAINKAAEAAKAKKDEKKQRMNAAKPQKSPLKVDELECEQ